MARIAQATSRRQMLPAGQGAVKGAVSKAVEDSRVKEQEVEMKSARFLTVLALVLVGAAGARSVVAQATSVTTNSRIPLPQPFQRLVPCAADGAGEIVDLGGTLHVLFHTTLDPSGGFHSKFHFQPQGVTGVGLTTGDVYQGTGVNQGHVNGTVGEESTFVDNFRLIGRGPGNNFLLHETVHMTVNANGVVTAVVSNLAVECR